MNSGMAGMVFREKHYRFLTSSSMAKTDKMSRQYSTAKPDDGA
jgi:hypothetical protein